MEGGKPPRDCRQSLRPYFETYFLLPVGTGVLDGPKRNEYRFVSVCMRMHANNQRENKIFIFWTAEDVGPYKFYSIPNNHGTVTLRIRANSRNS